MYVWPESIAHRGSNEVASCLHNYFQNLSGIDTLFLFSDSCPGQNKNYTIIHYLYSLVKMGLFQRIQHIFPIRGHSFLPSDRDFAKTESKKKKVDRLYIPDHWIDVIRSARKVKPFTVVPVSQELVYDFQSHLMPFFKKSVPRMRVHDVRVFEYALSHQNEVWVKYSLAAADEWHRFIVEKKKSPGPSFPIAPCYSGILPINPNKVDDLKKIVYKFVPREFRTFYDEIIEENVAGASSQSEE